VLRLAVLALTSLLPSTAVAQAVIQSNGRSVAVEIRDGETRHRCSTPCTLPVAEGLYRARVDGLDRQLDIVHGDAVVVRPTRRRQMALGIAMVGIGATAASVAASWAIDLRGRDRAIGAIGGLGLMMLAIPVITRASAKVLGQRGSEPVRAVTPERLIVSVGASYPTAGPTSATFVDGSIGYRLEDSRLSVGAIARHGFFDSGRATEILAGAELRLARLPIASINAGLAGGAERSRNKAGDLATGALFELSSTLQIELPVPIKPRVGLGYQIAAGGGVRHRLSARAGLAFQL